MRFFIFWCSDSEICEKSPARHGTHRVTWQMKKLDQSISNSLNYLTVLRISTTGHSCKPSSQARLPLNTIPLFALFLSNNIGTGQPDYSVRQTFNRSIFSVWLSSFNIPIFGRLYNGHSCSQVCDCPFKDYFTSGPTQLASLQARQRQNKSNCVLTIAMAHLSFMLYDLLNPEV